MKKLLLFASSLAVSLLIVEVALRILGVSYPKFTTIDAHRGFAMAPGAEGWQTREGRAYIKINSDGLRDAEHPFEKPGNTVRIAVLGDSYAQALQVPLEQTFWKILERDLSACQALQGRKVEMINFGVGGYGTAQELLTLRHRVWKYDPDLVLLAFLTGNDITDNSRALRGNPTVPYFDYLNGDLVLDESYRTASFRFKLAIAYGRIRQALDRFRTFQLIAEVRRAISLWGAQTKPKQQSELVRGNVPPGLEDGLDHAIYTPPANDAWERAWRVTEALLLTMAKEVREKGADFWIVTLTNGIQVNPDPEVRKAFRKWKQLHHLRYPDLRIRGLAQGNGIPIVTLVEPLAEYAERNKVYLHGFDYNPGMGHWNAEGHKAAGLEIAARMCESPSPALNPK